MQRADLASDIELQREEAAKPLGPSKCCAQKITTASYPSCDFLTNNYGILVLAKPITEIFSLSEWGKVVRRLFQPMRRQTSRTEEKK